jgi:polyphosphate kinase
MPSFFDRDISWLSFNERVLTEGGKEHVPVMERIRFLSIYSSNLDEFYRVRIPALKTLDALNRGGDDLLKEINLIIQAQQAEFGRLLHSAMSLLTKDNVHVLYNKPIPEAIHPEITRYFLEVVSGYLHIIDLEKKKTDFFYENNKIYILVILAGADGKEKSAIVNVPSDSISRFYSVVTKDGQCVIFLDDIIKHNLHRIFGEQAVKGAYTFKITRTAELDIADEYEGDLAKKIEEKVARRDYGLATRILYEPGLPLSVFDRLLNKLDIAGTSLMEGGAYHNLKDLANLPVKGDHFFYPPWPSVRPAVELHQPLMDEIDKGDVMLHPPYHSYETIIRFFNEAAIDKRVKEIYITLYRVAGESRIGTALINAARNGKKVTVFIELKARFDEENNIRWAKKMRAAGVDIIYSIPGLKVHAKIALVKVKHKKERSSYGLLSTGNFNESTGRFYTDHVLLTSNAALLGEMENVFRFLKKPKKAGLKAFTFKNLLVARFNLQQRFLELIDQEIAHARSGREAKIMIKLNNLEEEVLISKLYEASRAGVKIDLIVRSICRLIPGVTGMSETIRVTRIVDRYLEHGRIFTFHNNGNPKVYLGSSDWMSRNIYRRIEVCFPLLDPRLRDEILHLLHVQLSDNVQAVRLNEKIENEELHASLPNAKHIRSQEVISQFINAQG